MPGRNKGLYRKYTERDLEQAVEAIRDERYSIGAASRAFRVPKSTLKDYAKGRSPLGKKAGRQNSIPPQIENQIVDKVIESARKGFPLTKRQFLIKVGMLAKKLNLKTQFKDHKPSQEYWRSMKRRRSDLAIRNPEACVTNRMQGMNPQIVGSYFDDLQHFMPANGFHERPQVIWNADETGIQFVPGTAMLLAKKGCKQLYARRANTRDSVTMLVCISASGRAMPPLFVAKGKTMRAVQSFATHDAPEGSVWNHQTNAWMDNNLGVEWFRSVFLKHCGPERPQLLVLDSHASHEVLELLELARKENIHILALPPHTTHHLQPLDKVVFGPLKKAHKRIVTEFMAAHPHLTVNKVTWPGLMRQVWDEVMSPDLIQKAFAATELYLLDRTKILADAFAAAEALSRGTPETILAGEENAEADDSDDGEREQQAETEPQASKTFSPSH